MASLPSSGRSRRKARYPHHDPSEGKGEDQSPKFKRVGIPSQYVGSLKTLAMQFCMANKELVHAIGLTLRFRRQPSAARTRLLLA